MMPLTKALLKAKSIKEERDMTLQDWKDELDSLPVPDEITWYEMQGAFVLRWGKKTRKFFIQPHTYN